MVFLWIFAPGGRLCHEALHFCSKNVEIEIVYTSGQQHVEIEKVYTSGQQNVEIEKVYTSAQTHDFRTTKGKHSFAIYFPNVDLLMIKGKRFFVIFQVLANILGFESLGFCGQILYHCEMPYVKSLPLSIVRRLVL